jgi:hypothetical protein
MKPTQLLLIPNTTPQMVDHATGLAMLRAINAKLKEMFLGPAQPSPVVRLQRSLEKQNQRLN